MSKHRAPTLRGDLLPHALTMAMNGLLAAVGLITVVLPLTLNLLAPNGGYWTGLLPMSRSSASSLPTPSVERDPTSALPPQDEVPPDGAEQEEEQRSPEAAPPAPPAPREPAPPATKVPTFTKPGASPGSPPASAAPNAPAPSPSAPATPEPEPPVIDGCWDVLGCVNQLRAGAGVAPLSASGALDAFAQNWADSLAATDTYRYSDSGPAGFAVWEEYIVAGYAQGNWVVEALAGSPTQLAGLLDPAYTQLGVGVAGPADDPYWCLELGG